MESAPDGGRRRVLRPWGMRRTAPPTISPDMPDLADAEMPTRGTRLDPAVRFDLWIVGGLVVALVAVAWVNGATRPSRDSPHDASALAAGSAAYVTATTPSIVQEARLKAPPLVDVSSVATQRTEVTPHVIANAPSPARGQARGPAGIPVVIATQQPSVSVIDDARSEAPAPPVAPIQATPPPVSDRWQPLRSALAQCGAVNGTIGRAVCEQEARLAHCEGFWGLVTFCPTTRSEYGQ